MTSRKRLAMLVAVMLAGSLVAAVGRPIAVSGAGSLPECRYDDVRTRYTSHRDWKKTLLDTIFMLPRGAMPPPGLVSTDEANVAGAEKLRRFVIPDLRELVAAARADGVRLKVVSGYRGHSEQASLYRREVRNKGLEAGRLLVARPGHSEHHLGTAIDFGSPDDAQPTWQHDDWAQTPAGSWLYYNAWRFGFLLSYPRGNQAVTCYQYEPWHYRYVGRESAAQIRGTGLTLREFLWQQYH